MKSTLVNVLVFATGAAIGSLATWYFVKTKYERIAQEEIDSVKEALIGYKYKGPQDADEATGKKAAKNDIPVEEPHTDDPEQDYKEIVQKLGYHNYSDVEPTLMNKNDAPKEETPCASRVITPEEFGEVGYKLVELTYWADDVLTDTKNKRIQDVDALIGKSNLDRFGEYEPDALHVRNDEKKIDFEIMRDLKRYSDFFDGDSQQAEDE